jgi:hypothetical protein
MDMYRRLLSVLPRVSKRIATVRCPIQAAQPTLREINNMALGSTQPLTEMSTRKIPGG